MTSLPSTRVKASSAALLISVLLASLGALSGCAKQGTGGEGAAQEIKPGQPMAGYVGEDSPVDASGLRFERRADELRFEAARKCFAERTKAWVHFPLRSIGNFVEEDWCTGEGAQRGCSGGQFRGRPGSSFTSLHVLTHDDPPRDVFGTGLTVGVIQTDLSAWSLHLSAYEGGKGILGDGLLLNFSRGTGEDLERVFLGSSDSYDLLAEIDERNGGSDAEVRVQAKHGPWALLDQVRASPSALRAEGIARQKALLAAGLARLAEPLEKCIYGEYQGDGTPPACEERVALSGAELAQARAGLEAETTRVQDAFEANAEAFHALLIAQVGPGCVPSVASINASE